MCNAKEELLGHIGDKEVECISIVCPYEDTPLIIRSNSLAGVVDQLNFEYDSGFGCQELYGYIWYTDGTWSERVVYDGSEKWSHKQRPPVNIEIEIDEEIY